MLLLPTLLCAQSFDGGMVSRAGVPDLTARSSIMFRHNPAILGPKHAFMKSIDLPGFHGIAGNNAFDIDFWNDQFARDHYLTENDKNEILDRIPDDGLEITTQSSIPIAGMTYNKMGANITLENALRAKATKELFELALLGNELNRVYDLSDFEGEQYKLLDFSVGFVYEFQQEQIPGLYAGAGFHFYYGLEYDALAEAEGNFMVTDSLITGYSILHRVHGNRGDGVGFDLGGMAVLNDKWQVGLSLRQIGGVISWDIDKNEWNTFRADSNGIIIDSLDEEDYVERALHVDDVTYPGGTHQSQLPPIVEASAHYKLSSKSALMSMIRYRTLTSAQGETGVETGIGSEYRAKSWLPLSAGVSIGGPHGWQIGIGGGVSFKNYELRLGWTWNRGLFNSARGISVGLSQQIKF
jgi:hypothetical protein